MAQRRQTLLVDVEAGQPDGEGRHGEAGAPPHQRIRREVADELGTDGQQQRAGEPGPRTLLAVVVVAVMLVMGVFVVTDEGLVSLWRDYFDVGTFNEQLAAILS